MKNKLVEEASVDHANKVDDPENSSWHTRYSSFKQGYQKGQSDLLEEASGGFGVVWESFCEKNVQYGFAIDLYKKDFKEFYEAASLYPLKKMEEMKLDLKMTLDQLSNEFVRDSELSFYYRKWGIL